MKKMLLLSVLLPWVTIGYSQAISSEATSSAGGSFSNSEVQISWTIGEPISEYYNHNDHILTQGLHQPTILVNGLEDYEPQLSVSVFPNPTTQKLTIKFENIEKEWWAELYSSDGKLVKIEEVIGQKEATLDISSFSEGLYFLYLKEEKTNLKSFRIIKK